MSIFLLIWGKFFCYRRTIKGIIRHESDYSKEKPTGRVRPFTNPYENAPGTLVFTGTQVIAYNAEEKRISPPTEEEIMFELQEIESTCGRCGNKTRYWRHSLKSAKKKWLALKAQ